MANISNPALSKGPAGKIVFNGITYYKPRTLTPEARSLQNLDFMDQATLSEGEEINAYNYRIGKPNRRKVVDKKEEKEIRLRKIRAYAI